MNFTELNLKPELENAIKKAGYTEASPIQEKAIPIAITGSDMIACAQTGTGKTATFALPILNRLDSAKKDGARALVLTPTRELALQNYNNFKKYGRYMDLRVACFYGGSKESTQLAQYRRGCDIIVATPGRLLDYIERGVVSLGKVEIFVLDEADRMLDMGFIHDMRKIAAKIPAKHQTLLFSATMPRPIENLAQEMLTNPETVKVAPTTSPAETVEQKICFVRKADKKAVLTAFLAEEGVEKAIVFTRTKHAADKLVKTLKRDDEIAAVVIHGDRSQGQRQSALESFKCGKADVLVATDVAARGIDIHGVTHVYNYDLPQEAESYIHRIGRAGRAGAEGVAISICSDDEMDLLFDIEKMMNKPIAEIPTAWSIIPQRKALNAPKEKKDNKRGGRGNRSAQGQNKSTQGRNGQNRGAQNASEENARGRRGAEARTENNRGRRGTEARTENNRGRRGAEARTENTRSRRGAETRSENRGEARTKWNSETHSLSKGDYSRRQGGGRRQENNRGKRRAS